MQGRRRHPVGVHAGEGEIMTRRTDLVRDRNVYTPLGYRSVDQARREGRFPMGGSEEYHARYDRGKLINQSRAFRRDNGLYRGLIDRAVTNIVRGGFGLQARTTSKKWNATAEGLWREWSAAPEARGLLSWRQVQQMVCREILLTGDVGAVKISKGAKKGRLQLVESEQIAANDNANGIKLNTFGEPTAFYVSRYGTQGQVSKATPKEYEPKDFLFVPLLDRPSQVRGVPVCQASFAMLHRISDVCDSEALAWQILARLAIAITREDAGAEAYATSDEDPEHATTDTSDLSSRLHELDTALIFHAEPGESVTGIDRNIPGKNFTESIRMFLRLLGLPLGLPLEMVLLDWSQSNYSSARASLEQAFAVFEDYQNLLEDRLTRLVYTWKVDGWIAARKLTDRGDKYRHEWIKPAFPWIDHLKECQAWGAKLDRGLVTYAKACKSLNSDREEVVASRRLEVEDAIRIAQEIEKQSGVTVPWQIFAGLKPPTPKKTDGDDEGAGGGSAGDELPDPRAPENEPRAPREP